MELNIRVPTGTLKACDSNLCDIYIFLQVVIKDTNLMFKNNLI